VLVYVVGLYSGGLILNNVVGYWAYIWGGGRLIFRGLIFGMIEVNVAEH
jgi:hypothetical protein